MTQRARGIVRSAGLLVVAAVLAGGCHDPFSNQWFEEDELFIAAIPDEERVTTRVPRANGEDRRGTWGEDPPPPPNPETSTFALWTWQASYELNLFVYILLTTVERVTSTSIAFRSQHERIWGPIDMDGFPITEMAIWLYMDRITMGVEERFDYSLEWRDADADRDDGTVPFRGSFAAGAVPREGVGDFRFDFGLMYELQPGDGDPIDGVMTVEHDNRNGGVDLRIALQGITDPAMDPWDADYAFSLVPEGSGWFEYAADGNLEDSEPKILEHWEIRTRWQADGAGRGDARISGGELGAAVFHVVECWDADLRRTYYADDTGYTVPFGDPEDCVFVDQELPTHL